MRRLLRRAVIASFVVAVFWGEALAADARPLEIEDLFRLRRVSEPQVSPDGQQVVYVVTEVLKAENRTNADLWLVPVAGGEPRQLTTSPKHDRHPRWSPDGKWIAFESARDGQSQIWLLPVSGGEPRKLTTLSTGASQPVWSPDGRKLAFVSSVYPEFSDKPFAESDKLNKEKAEAAESSKVKARVFTELLYRHWDTWSDGTRQHVFVIDVENGAAVGEPRDVTPGPNDAVPNSMTFDAGDEFAFSPDGSELFFTAPPEQIREQAWSTNYDIWAVNLQTLERRRVTDNPAADGQPRFSPDGKFVAYRAQSRPGAEADRWQLFVIDRASGQHRSLTADWDFSVGDIKWSPDSRAIYVEAEENGANAYFRVALSGGKPERVLSGGTFSDLNITRDGTYVFSRAKLNAPPEVFAQAKGAREPRAITRTNAELLSGIAMNAPESVTVPGAGGTPVQMWILKPPHFDASKKYPLVFWVHGGPQGAWNDGWSTRWNAQVWAAQGYVLALPNPRGSTGFGQKFTDEISHDWGGKVFEDLMACLAYLEQQPYIDTTRMASAGASYGGYMMNWFQGHTDKFRTLITHCGVYDFISMYGTTEEVWFDEWEHGIPWETPDFEKFSPHRFAANFKTPNLIIHNELDFRVPLNQGLSLFTTLQRKGIPSKLLVFPDEGHWVLKPQNSELWHRTVFDWLAEYLKN
ncbi:MAG: S9 family peptidase [Opitutus sp.]|nr:S9 family peptidase [Opitutus sp.]